METLLKLTTVEAAQKLTADRANSASTFQWTQRSAPCEQHPKPQTYTHAQALNAARMYFGGDEMAAAVWVSKYALKDSYGNIYEQTPADMHRRLAREIARIERRYPNPMTEDDIFALLDHFRCIIPQGGPMTGIGNPYQVASLSNCFVIGANSDSYGSIFRIDEEQVQLMKRRGGVGHDLSHIRYTGSPVMNSALNSTGVVPFMERYSNSTREVAMDGRRGALMLSLSVKHPDAERFIDAKLDLSKVTGANISIKLDDEFMRCAANNSKYIQQFPVNADNPMFRTEINARALWEKIIHNAWKNGEPGVLFWDTIIRNSLPDCYADYGFRTISTNPCGEIPLCAYDSCRLLSINLYGYVDNPFTANATFNLEKFKNHIAKAMRIMDDIIDLEIEKIDAISAKIDADPEPDDIRRVERNLWKKIREKATLGRRTGLGITAVGDMLAAMGLRYGSQESIDFAVQTQQTLALEAYRASTVMAQERGAFPIYNANLEENNPMMQRIAAADPTLYAEMRTHGRRNIAMLTIAPAGTTSIMSQTSSGIEPVFNLRYKRRRKINHNDKNVEVNFVDKQGDAFEEYAVLHHKFQSWLEANGYSDEDIVRIKNLPNEEWQQIVAQSPYGNATSDCIDWASKVKLQGRMQSWVDHSISATVNLPNKITEEMVEIVYKTAWEAGCKGITVYRDGSRDGVLVNTEPPKTSAAAHSIEAPPKKRPQTLDADIIRFNNKNQKWIAFVGLYNGKPYEIFTGSIADIDKDLRLPAKIAKGSVAKVYDADGISRYDLHYVDAQGAPQILLSISSMFDKEYWNYARLISGALRSGMPLVEVVNIVDHMRSEEENINSWKSGVKRALKGYIPNGTKSSVTKCPSCGSENLVYQEGCLMCMTCGDSKCG